MYVTGTTELIWHFAGYLKLHEDAATQRFTYQSLDPTGQNPDDLMLIGPSPVDRIKALPTHPYIDTKPFRGEQPETHKQSFDLPPSYRDLPKHPVDHVPPSAAAAADHLLARAGDSFAGRGGGSRQPSEEGEDPGPRQVTVSYDIGGAGSIAVMLSQANLLVDADLLRMPNAALEAPGAADLMALANALLAEAGAPIPESLETLEGSSISLLDLIAEPSLDDWDPGEEYDGTYVNGEPGEAPEIDLGAWGRHEPATEGTDGEAAQILYLGNNLSINAAEILDISEAKGGLIVLGDYVETNAIFQVNVLRDHDTFRIAHGASPDIVGGGNEAYNIATFARQDGLYGNATLAGVSYPVHWQVDVLEQDVWDVVALFQTNWMIDPDTIAHTETDAYSYVVAGENGQTNYASFADLTFEYDLIIVAGSYYEGNYIIQRNVVLDDDWLALSGSGDSSGYGGENLLLNDATIVNVGGGPASFVPLTEEAAELVASLQNQDPLLDPTLAAYFGASGSATFKVLYIEGDFYQLKLIDQTNLLVDADTAAQLYGDGEQLVAAGGNAAANIAVIVDVDSDSDIQFLGGEYYEDTMLVQSEIVMDDEEITYGDPETLVAEVVAFMGPPGESEDDEPGPSTGSSTPDGDIMGGVMA